MVQRHRMTNSFRTSRPEAAVAVAPGALIALRDELISEALHRGFAAAGIAGVRPFARARERALRAVAEGRMDGMAWYDRHRAEGITDPAAPHPWARSLLALAWPCPPAAAPRRHVAVPAAH